MRPGFGSQSAGYPIAVAGIALTTVVLTPIRAHVNTTTVALALLLVVVFVASVWGSKPALLASFLGMACFNFFFLPPVGTFHIADPDNWIALAAFLITALTVGQLSARAKRRAESIRRPRRFSAVKPKTTASTLTKSRARYVCHTQTDRCPFSHASA